MSESHLIADAPVRYEEAAEIARTPAAYAAGLHARYSRSASEGDRRELGQYFTPVAVARMMAELGAVTEAEELRILEPGSGAAVLTAALCESLPLTVKRIHIDTYELHPSLADLCEETLRFTSSWLEERGTRCTFIVHRKDFVLENASCLRAELFGAREGYDIAISNPPYFKLQKQDPRARAAAEIVHGQPNIYAIFMAIMAGMLKEKGTMVTITPRSFAAGDYFRRFRQALFSIVIPEAVHLFGSRRDAFRTDEILQENVILSARRISAEQKHHVTVSTSLGVGDLEARSRRQVPLARVVDLKSRSVTLHIPTSSIDDDVLTLVGSWPETLHSLGLEVSTGPVVAFRATEFLRSELGTDTVPMLWLQHVKQMNVEWPASTSKRQHIISSSASEALLLPNRTYVVMRRFSAKEEHRRLVAAPLIRGELPGEMIGLENHLNYIYRPQRVMSAAEARGLAILLNSALVDRYFRISNGNTQVSAAELRQMPLPSREQLEAIGQSLDGQSISELDRIVTTALHVPERLSRELERGPDAEG
jgi:adenine-specific DNA-methyltransferase